MMLQSSRESPVGVLPSLSLARGLVNLTSELAVLADDLDDVKIIEIGGDRELA